MDVVSRGAKKNQSQKKEIEINISMDMNIVTYDIEEWYIEETLYGDRKEKYVEYDDYLDRILDILDNNDLKATFFCLGGLSPKYNYIIKKIANRGHEVGCHSNHHYFLNKMTYKDALSDTREALDSIEQVIGQKVLSYRAPAFSIGESNIWVFDVLAECGIERDASVFPAHRDYGGFSSFPTEKPCIIKHNGFTIKEFPICLSKIFNRKFAYSGGGYFRFFPLWYINRQMSLTDYSMTYFHIGDLSLESQTVLTKNEYESYFKEKGSLINRYKRHIKTNLGKKGAFEKMEALLSKQRFLNLAEADVEIDWKDAIIIDL